MVLRIQSGDEDSGSFVHWLPARLASLHELAMNLRWSWDERTRDLFRWVDPDQWEVTGHDPVRLLGLVSRALQRKPTERQLSSHER